MQRKKDYLNKEYKNPFFRKKKPTRKRVFWWVLFGIIVAVIIYLLFFSKYFVITDIKVTGNKNISAAEISKITAEQLKKRRFLLFGQDNIFMVNRDKIEKNILEEYILEKVRVKRLYPNTIEIEIFEKLSALAWLSDDKAYYVDLQGVAFAPVNSQQVDEEGEGEIEVLRHKIISQNLPIVYDLGSREVELGEEVASEKVVSFIIDLVTNVKKLVNYEIAYYNYSLQGREVDAVTSEGWEVKFSIDGDLDSQLNNLTLMLREEIKNPRELDYIDLRFGEKIFYK